MSLLDSESFAVVSEVSSKSIGKEYEDANSAKLADLDLQITQALRDNYPELCLTITPRSSAPLLQFAEAGYATAELDIKDETIFRWRGWIGPQRRGGSGQVGDAIFFAKYHYQWAEHHYIMYTVDMGISGVIQYLLTEPDKSKGEHPLSNNAATDALIRACALSLEVDETEFVYVYDRYWTRSRSLWEDVQNASWDKVILDPKQKKSLTSLTESFFDSKDVYKKYGVPWKRGIIFYGPPGNGKTISVKALMRDLSLRKQSIPTLYVKSAPYTYDIDDVFSFARSFAPCMLVMEDIETIVTSDTRSYFFNEMDGIENNDGKQDYTRLFIVATTNFLDRLDPGLSKRPSRFDRKFEFPLPSREERVQYAEFWRERIAQSSPEIEFPEKICKALADITKKFSFAYIQEAFVASLLMLAREDQDDEYNDKNGDEDDSEDQLFAKPMKDDPLDKYRLWRALKTNVKILREDLNSGNDDALLSRGDGAVFIGGIRSSDLGNPANSPPRALKQEPQQPFNEAVTLRDRARMHYFTPNSTKLTRSGTVPSQRSFDMPQTTYGNAARVSEREFPQIQNALRRSGTVQPVRAAFLGSEGSSSNISQASQAAPNGNIFDRRAPPPRGDATSSTSQGFKNLANHPARAFDSSRDRRD